MALTEIKLVIFDLDGTLVKFPKEFLFQQAEEVVKTLELPSVERELMEEAFADFDFFRWIPSGIRETFMDTYWNLFNWEHYPKPIVFDGVLETLKALKDNGIDQGVVTSRHFPREQIEADLKEVGILDYFSYVIPRGGDDERWHDKTYQIRQACERSGVEPKHVALVGDIPPDVSCARVLGLGKTVAVLSGGIRREPLEKAEPTHIIDGVWQLLDVLEL